MRIMDFRKLLLLNVEPSFQYFVWCVDALARVHTSLPDINNSTAPSHQRIDASIYHKQHRPHHARTIIVNRLLTTHHHDVLLNRGIQKPLHHYTGPLRRLRSHETPQHPDCCTVLRLSGLSQVALRLLPPRGDARLLSRGKHDESPEKPKVDFLYRLLKTPWLPSKSTATSSAKTPRSTLTSRLTSLSSTSLSTPFAPGSSSMTSPTTTLRSSTLLLKILLPAASFNPMSTINHHLSSRLTTETRAP